MCGCEQREWVLDKRRRSHKLGGENLSIWEQRFTFWQGSQKMEPEILAKGTREAGRQGGLCVVLPVEPCEFIAVCFVLVFMKQDYTMSLLSPGWPWTGDLPSLSPKCCNYRPVPP